MVAIFWITEGLSVQIRNQEHYSSPVLNNGAFGINKSIHKWVQLKK